MAQSPFPGMDPYMEREWQQLAISLPVYLSETLNESLPQDLVARISVREVPDHLEEHLRRLLAARGKRLGSVEPIRQRFLEIRLTSADHSPVTVIEFVHPSNKHFPAEGKRYAAIQIARLVEGIHVVEIDLNRWGNRTLAMPVVKALPTEATYVASVRRAPGTRAEIYPMPLCKPLATIPVPLRNGERDVLLELQPAIDREYRSGRHELNDYSRPLDPPLAGAEAEFAERVLKEAGKR